MDLPYEQEISTHPRGQQTSSKPKGWMRQFYIAY